MGDTGEVPIFSLRTESFRGDPFKRNARFRRIACQSGSNAVFWLGCLRPFINKILSEVYDDARQDAPEETGCRKPNFPSASVCGRRRAVAFISAGALTMEPPVRPGRPRGRADGENRPVKL
jgi:hypothetical protein